MIRLRRMGIDDKEFDFDQLKELRAGLDSGVDVTLYAKKEFLAIQMREIRQGLEEGLDVSRYASMDYDWFQMEEIRKGLRASLNVDCYASPEIPYDKMRQVRKGLALGIDLSRFLKLNAKTLRQLRKAYVSKVNIVDYVKKGYEPEQLDEIRQALEKKLDIDPYLIKEMRGIAIHEICIGLEEGLDVSQYAKIEYSWQQMRELRRGLENRVDISQYSNSMYSAPQMKEIRLGLEAGLDVSGYRSLVYTATDMEKKRNKILEDFARAIVAKSREPVKIEDFIISVSGDELEAYLEIRGSTDNAYQKQEILQALEKEGIKEGILTEEIDRILEQRQYNAPVLIAKGKKPQKGADGWYEYFFETNPEKNQTLLEDGSVDYETVFWFEMVKEGERVACYHEAEEGEPGFTVTGKVLPTTRGREQKVLSCQGVLLLYDKTTYVASIDGRIELKENQLSVSSVYILDEVTRKSGNVDFEGSVLIRGKVERGTEVRAARDIVVEGDIGDCVLQCGGSLLVRKGAKGIKEGKLDAGENVAGKYFDSVKIYAGKDVYANYMVNCEIYAENQVIIPGGKGVLAGGLVQAVEGIRVHHLGNQNGVETIVRMGVNKTLLKEQRLLERKMERVHNDLSVLGNVYLKYHRKYKPEVRNTMDMYLKIEAAIYAKEKEEEELYRKKQEMAERIEKMENVKAIIHGKLFEGTIFEIDQLRWHAKAASNITVKRMGERIAVYSN
ncbi:MAG: DUF342 domain-containing protein [Lachnospiraceae bacterium]|nr:DUF342 domain-containing protein [Lachnospiraceae bacterium]